jgi:hypothetical protein
MRATTTTRGAVNSPFSPVGTPRFHLGAATNARMSTGDADYAAFVRHFCFARSPSPSARGAPLGEPAPELPAKAPAPGLGEGYGFNLGAGVQEAGKA